MEETLQALAGILLRAIPTLILVLFLHFYLKKIFFEPLGEILRKRREATQGARDAAAGILGKATEKAGEYEAALREARLNLHREQEENRRRLLEEQASRVEEAKAGAHAMIHEAKKQLAEDTEGARRQLAASAGALADTIADAVLNGRAA